MKKIIAAVAAFALALPLFAQSFVGPNGVPNPNGGESYSFSITLFEIKDIFGGKKNPPEEVEESKKDEPVQKAENEVKELPPEMSDAAAIDEMTRLAQNGNANFQYSLGRCYDKGHGVEENNKEAFKWYSKSADQGYYKAEYQMARSYIKGKGVEPDEKKAKAWVKKAVGGKKHGAEMLQEIKDGAAEGDKTDQKLLQLLQ